MNRAIQCFTIDTYGTDVWMTATRTANLGFSGFEPMLIYEDQLTEEVIAAITAQLNKPREVFLEDLGTYLVSHPTVEALRRLLRFGGVDFVEFLHSLDDLADRARLAVSDLHLPELVLDDHGGGAFSLTCTSRHAGFGHVFVGVLRAMADDYGALVYMEHRGRTNGAEVIGITLVEQSFAEGRQFELGAGAA